ncbi:aminodeoxychorismate lyase [Ketobacter sp. MCCC 1A13808]|uniref:aminodeoxychorismate lyase n=1 Tax=Ketobacter sp. MCCC 1A13808 TaxID=2602738 RepID=UPI000F19AD19|nr:aminodeoxychorismate lyase [Ketobacter sp. MCCC 1A13808]MVF10683.1 aminodeoxychorismate lyase [Ketobacter sp. MCCC 1A13808]RLP56101.1 MAG: aminodeoxychorismate lyase [Ketobacter sp.]
MSEQSKVDFPWINGSPAAQGGLSTQDRGLAYGDGVFETIRVSRSGPVLMSLHLERLYRGLRRLAIEIDPVLLESELASYPGFKQCGVVKIIVTRGAGGRGYSCENSAPPTRIFTSHPEPAYPSQNYDEGISVFPCATRLSSHRRLAGIKHLNRLEQVLARQEWAGQEYQEGLVLDQYGKVVEGVFSNVFVVKNKTVLTPAIEQCGVAGVMRHWLLQQFAVQGYNPVEGELTPDNFKLADERFFCNSVYGVWPVRRFEENTWPAGPVARLAQKMVSEHWCL